MSHDELMAKRDLCLDAAEQSKTAKVLAIWIRKANDLRRKAMRKIENCGNINQSEIYIIKYGFEPLDGYKTDKHGFVRK